MWESKPFKFHYFVTKITFKLIKRWIHMTPYYSFASGLRSCFYDTLVLQVWTTLRPLQRCDWDSNMYNDLKLALEVVEELGRLKLVDALVEASDVGTQALGRGGQSGGSQRHRCRGGGRVGCGRTPSWNLSMRKGMTRVQKSNGLRVIEYCLTTVAGHYDARLMLVLGHPTSPVMRTLFQPKLCPVVLAWAMRTLVVCRPQFLMDLPIMVDAYLSLHQACLPHL